VQLNNITMANHEGPSTKNSAAPSNIRQRKQNHIVMMAADKRRRACNRFNGVLALA